MLHKGTALADKAERALFLLLVRRNVPPCHDLTDSDQNPRVTGKTQSECRVCPFDPVLIASLSSLSLARLYLLATLLFLRPICKLSLI